MKVPKDLENRIKRLEGRFKEFIDIMNLRIIEKNAKKKTKYLVEIKKFSEDRREFIGKVIYLFDLTSIYTKAFQDNFDLSKNDKEYIICMNGENCQLASFVMRFPHENTFFREDFETLTYSVSEIYLDAETQIKVEKEFTNYEKAFEYWKNEFAEGA